MCSDELHARFLGGGGAAMRRRYPAAPGRTAAQVAVVLAAHAGWAPSPRTLQRHFAACGLTRWRPDGAPPAT
ncbi:MAG TPA: hypothetical protein VFC16_08240, partial [Nakamurella sp.]|nr:hypothetical protein [Nakamurella sp.]